MDSLKKILPYVACLILAAMLVQTCVNNKQREKEFQNNLRISRDSTKHFKDKHGQLVSEKETMELTINDLNKQAESLGIDKKRLKDQVGKQGQLLSYYKGQLNAKGTGDVKGVDTTFWEDTVWDGLNDSTKVTAQRFRFDNKFLKFDALYDPLKDSLKLKYEYKVGIELTNYRTRRKFIVVGPRQTYADVRLSDPNAKMFDAQSILIKEPPKKFYEQWYFILGVGFVIGTVVTVKFL